MRPVHSSGPSTNSEPSAKPPSDQRELSDHIKTEAQRLGFALVGIAPAVAPAGFQDFCDWLERGCAGEMAYLQHRRDAYAHPRNILDGVRSVVLLGIDYRTSEPRQPEPMEGLVSRYAWGPGDYHLVIRDKLHYLADELHTLRPDCRTRCVVDTAPLLERDFARLAGLGWIGKNTMLIHKRLGSWLFLAALLVDIELVYDRPHATSHCGTCTRCLDACPTQAFPTPYVLDSRKCISYLTIELRDVPVPVDLRLQVGQQVFGCDVCQEVCPWNRKAVHPICESRAQTHEPVSQDTKKAFEPIADLDPADAVALLSQSESAFRSRFRDTPLWRLRRAGLARNAAIVLGNSGDYRAVPALEQALTDPEPIVRGAAAWALGRIGGVDALRALESRLNDETNAGVLAERNAALQNR